jgi:hypothetical protein
MPGFEGNFDRGTASIVRQWNNLPIRPPLSQNDHEKSSLL